MNLAGNERQIHVGEQKRLQKAVAERVYQICKNPEKRPEMFQKAYSSLKLRYNVNSYKDIKQSQLQDALRFIAHWDGRAT